MCKDVRCQEDECPCGMGTHRCCFAEIDPEKSGEVTTLWLKCKKKKGKKVKIVIRNPDPTEAA